jgi:acetylornithine deacetylase
VNSPVVSLASRLISLDTRSEKSNLPLVEFLEAELAGFELERISYTDANPSYS